MKAFTAIAKRWFDRINGNTYHSVRIIRHSDGAVLLCPFQYGYGDQYRYTALEAMCENGWLPGEYVKEPDRTDKTQKSLFCFERENDYPILWTVSDGLKRDCVRNGVEG